MNNKRLIIVESPSKAKTISKYLDDKYEVLASVGHIKDLPKKDLGVDIDDNFAIVEDILPDKKSFFKELIDLANKTNQVVIATDPDREGEAIAAHIALPIISHSLIIILNMIIAIISKIIVPFELIHISMERSFSTGSYIPTIFISFEN